MHASLWGHDGNSSPVCSELSLQEKAEHFVLIIQCLKRRKSKSAMLPNGSSPIITSQGLIIDSWEYTRWNFALHAFILCLHFYFRHLHLIWHLWCPLQKHFFFNPYCILLLDFSLIFFERDSTAMKRVVGKIHVLLVQKAAEFQSTPTDLVKLLV